MKQDRIIVRLENKFDKNLTKIVIQNKEIQMTKRTNYVIVLVFLAIFSIPISAEEIYIDFNDASNYYPSGGQWNELDVVNSTKNNLTDISGDGTTVDITTLGFSGDDYRTTHWDNGTVDWVTEDAGRDMHFSFGAGVTITFDDLTEDSYTVELLATSDQNFSGSYMINDAYAQQTHNGAEADCSADWNQLTDGETPANWIVFENAIPSGGQLIIDMNPVSTAVVVNAIKILGSGVTLPVTLSSFAAIQTNENLAQLDWTTESESNLVGYNIYRNNTENVNTSMALTTSLVQATNTSTGSSYTYIDEEVMAEQTYYYWLESVELNGSTEQFGPVTLTITPAEDKEEIEVILPSSTEINNVYPNPFNPSTTISFSIKENDTASIEVFSINGQLVRSLGHFAAGNHVAEWNGKDNVNVNVASGLYFFRMKSNTVTSIKKVMLLK